MKKLLLTAVISLSLVSCAQATTLEQALHSITRVKIVNAVTTVVGKTVKLTLDVLVAPFKFGEAIANKEEN